jgi:hypothetical protein
MLASRFAQQSKLWCCEEFLYDFKPPSAARALTSGPRAPRGGSSAGTPLARVHAVTAAELTGQDRLCGAPPADAISGRGGTGNAEGVRARTEPQVQRTAKSQRTRLPVFS